MTDGKPNPNGLPVNQDGVASIESWLAAVKSALAADSTTVRQAAVDALAKNPAALELLADLTAAANQVSKPQSSLPLGFDQLTPRQIEVALLISEKGLLNKQIAFELGVSEATIKAHVGAILGKLKLNSRTQLAIALGQPATRPATNAAAEPPSDELPPPK